ncbi:hypothetical protein AB0F11_24665 [Streptomyces sp. NPDC032472]|uniref:hypothetical protein n=1 Tax=Streptomyces sp. NPDC032472 TaxID=3155018 RepID=UPI0033CEE9B3
MTAIFMTRLSTESLRNMAYATLSERCMKRLADRPIWAFELITLWMPPTSGNEDSGHDPTYQPHVGRLREPPHRPALSVNIHGVRSSGTDMKSGRTAVRLHECAGVDTADLVAAMQRAGDYTARPAD